MIIAARCYCYAGTPVFTHRSFCLPSKASVFFNFYNCFSCFFRFPYVVASVSNGDAVLFFPFPYYLVALFLFLGGGGGGWASRILSVSCRVHVVCSHATALFFFTVDV